MSQITDLFQRANRAVRENLKMNIDGGDVLR